MKAQDLKIGSTIQIEIYTTDETGEMVTKNVIVPITRCSETYVWFKHMGLQRVGRTTIDKFPTLYKIVSL